MSRNRNLANILSKSTDVATDSELALVQIIPTSITATGGSGSISTTGAVSFTSASAISLNNVFSSTYENYRLLINITDNTVDGDIWYKNRVSGTDASSSYYWGRFYIDSYSTGSYGISANNNVSYIGIGRSSSGSYKLGIDFVVYKPQIAAQKTITGLAEVSTGASSIVSVLGGAHTTATAYDSFSIGVTSGIITGTIRVYGIKN